MKHAYTHGCVIGKILFSKQLNKLENDFPKIFRLFHWVISLTWLPPNSTIQYINLLTPYFQWMKIVFISIAIVHNLWSSCLCFCYCLDEQSVKLRFVPCNTHTHTKSEMKWMDCRYCRRPRMRRHHHQVRELHSLQLHTFCVIMCTCAMQMWTIFRRRAYRTSLEYIGGLRTASGRGGMSNMKLLCFQAKSLTSDRPWSVVVAMRWARQLWAVDGAMHNAQAPLNCQKSVGAASAFGADLDGCVRCAYAVRVLVSICG